MTERDMFERCMVRDALRGTLPSDISDELLRASRVTSENTFELAEIPRRMSGWDMDFDRDMVPRDPVRTRRRRPRDWPLPPPLPGDPPTVRMVSAAVVSTEAPGSGTGSPDRPARADPGVTSMAVVVVVEVVVVAGVEVVTSFPASFNALNAGGRSAFII